MRACGLMLGLAFTALSSIPAWTQAVTAPQPAKSQWAIYAEGSGGSLHFPDTHNIYGSTFGLYHTKTVDHVTIGPDFRGSYLERGASLGPFTDQALATGLVGVRVAATPMRGHFMPYAEGMFGIAYWR